MNTKRFILAGLAVFIVWEILTYVIHTLIMGGLYEASSHLWRQDMAQKMWIMTVTAFVFSFLFVYIFTKGYENRGIGEGFRFGLLIGVFYTLPHIFDQFVIYPVDFLMAIQWFIFGIIEFIIIGMVAAVVYRPKP